MLAVEEDVGVDILHRCGAYAKRTICCVEFLEGEPGRMTEAECEVLESRDLLGQVRLSCQILYDHDIKVQVPTTVTSTARKQARGTNYTTPECAEKPAHARSFF